MNYGFKARRVTPSLPCNMAYTKGFEPLRPFSPNSLANCPLYRLSKCTFIYELFVRGYIGILVRVGLLNNSPGGTRGEGVPYTLLPTTYSCSSPCVCRTLALYTYIFLVLILYREPNYFFYSLLLLHIKKSN